MSMVRDKPPWIQYLQNLDHNFFLIIGQHVYYSDPLHGIRMPTSNHRQHSLNLLKDDQTDKKRINRNSE